MEMSDAALEAVFERNTALRRDGKSGDGNRVKKMPNF
jgi:hypothetical protein